MSAPTATIEPTEFFAGDTIDWTKDLTDYRPGDGWTLSYYLRGPKAYDLTSTTDTTNANLHRVTVTASTSSAYVPGSYTVQGFAIKSGERRMIYDGAVTIYPDPSSTSVPVDRRTHNQKALDAIKAVLEGRAGSDQLRYQIGTRTVEKIPHSELIELKDYYDAAVKKDEHAKAIAQGRTPWKKIAIRF